MECILELFDAGQYSYAEAKEDKAIRTVSISAEFNSTQFNDVLDAVLKTADIFNTPVGYCVTHENGEIANFGFTDLKPR